MIHKFIFDGVRLVLDVNSGALHLVDRVVWDLLEEYPGLQREEVAARYADVYSRQEVAEAIEEIEQLVHQGLLFAGDPLGGSWQPPGHRIVKALCLHLAHTCNLKCSYCFAGQGSFGESAGLMPLAVGQQAIDFLLAASGPRRHVEVDFFGGEPLLNFPVLEHLVSYGREKASLLGKEIKYTVTTNAVQLNERIGNYLDDNRISVILSLDGRREVHDKWRVFPDGRGSYEIVANNISRFLDSHPKVDYYLRGTFTRYNLDFASDVLHMSDLGFPKVSVEPVVAFEEEDYAFREEDLPLVCAEYEHLTRELLARSRRGQKVDFYHFNIDLDEGPCLLRRLSGCGAGYEYLAVTYKGDLYPCHQFVGRPEYRMGDVYKGIVRDDLRDLFRHAHVYSKEGCSACWARFYCSGGCHANAHAFNGSIRKPYQLACRLMRKRLECALYLQAMKTMEGGW